MTGICEWQNQFTLGLYCVAQQALHPWLQAAGSYVVQFYCFVPTRAYIGKTLDTWKAGMQLVAQAEAV